VGADGGVRGLRKKTKKINRRKMGKTEGESNWWGGWESGVYKKTTQKRSDRDTIDPALKRGARPLAGGGPWGKGKKKKNRRMKSTRTHSI